MPIIYSHLNTITNLRYIGYTTKTLEERFNIHCKKARGNSNLKFHNAIRKYGVDVWISEILEEVEENKLCEREIFWISFYDSYNNGYNLTHGGDGRGFVKGRKQTQKSNELRSKTMKDLYSGGKHPFKGVKQSEEKKQKIRQTLTGVKHSVERRINQSIGAKNRKKDTCIYCSKIADVCNLQRWHNEKCKFKGKEILFCESLP
jgi:group I intron endonuclease